MPPSKKDPYKQFLEQRKETAYQEYHKLVEDHRKGAEIILQRTQAVVNETEIIRVPTQPSAEFKEMANQLIHMLQPVHMLSKYPPGWMIQEHKDYQKAWALFEGKKCKKCLDEHIVPYHRIQRPQDTSDVERVALMNWRYSLMRAMILPLGWMV
ncbi:MAG: hypothetical protein L6R37_007616 [Teloschistes peruensis]|nr:MAG: hypothetical protein L6R37_007616 [Teloschistes peruensis]